jgi:hypothetical protein
MSTVDVDIMPSAQQWIETATTHVTDIQKVAISSTRTRIILLFQQTGLKYIIKSNKCFYLLNLFEIYEVAIYKTMISCMKYHFWVSLTHTKHSANAIFDEHNFIFTFCDEIDGNRQKKFNTATSQSLISLF